METASKRPKLNMVSLAILIVITGLFFTIFQVFYMPHSFENLGGKHAWVSGSTIKYVNMWLQEGAGKLHFTNMEKFPSVELPTFDDRGPYVSYPTGVTFMVWSAAKLCGRNHIDISFLKHFQLIMYGLEGILMSLFIYVFCIRCMKTNEKLSVIISLLISSFWITLPVNNWFLTNIYWTDMAVIFWIIAYLLLESVSDWDVLPTLAKKMATILKVLVIVAGVLTEYFFCIVVFLGFVFDIFYTIRKCDEKKLKNVFLHELIYIVPVVFALVVYVWQMSYTSDWVEQLLDTFFNRAGASNVESVTGKFWDSFMNAMTCGSKARAIVLLLVEIVALMGTVLCLFKKKIRSVCSNKAAISVGILVIAPVVQIMVFLNHSSIHQYSIVKMGLQIVGIILAILGLAPIMFEKAKRKVTLSVIIGICCFISVLVATGYPGRIKSFYQEKNKELDYSIAEAIKENTDYYDVCFSFTYVVSNNPPMDIAVCEKMVYEIETIEAAYEMFENLPQEANLVLVVDKNNIGSNDYIDREKSADLISKEDECIAKGNIIFEDDNCVLVKLPSSL